jgi:hypothetical protein
MEGLRKTMKNCSQDSWSPGQDLKPGPPKYKAGVLTIRPQYSVKEIQYKTKSIRENLK